MGDVLSVVLFLYHRQLDKFTVWNLFGLDVSGRLAYLQVRRTLEDLQEVEFRLLRAGLLGPCQEVGHVRPKSGIHFEYKVHRSHPPLPSHLLHITSARGGSNLKFYHQWEYIQLSTGGPSY